MIRSGIISMVLLICAAMAGAGTIFVPGDHATIQGAVDAAAAGDTVRVAAGTYEEQVVVTKNLALLGDGPSTTLLRAPLSMPHSVGVREEHAVISVEEPATSVVVSGFTVDGLGRGPETGAFDGVLFYRTGGELSDMVVRGVHLTPVDDTNNGLCIKASADVLEPSLPLVLRNVEASRFQKAGIVLTGPWRADLQGIRVHTDGLYSDSVQIGIECSFADSVRIDDCLVENVVYDSHPHPEYTAVALLGYYSDHLQVSDLTADACQSGVYLVSTEADIDHATVDADSEASLYNHGMVVVTSLTPDPSLETVALPAPRPLADGEVEGGGRPIESWRVVVRDSDLNGHGSDSSRGLALRCLTAYHLRLTAERCRITGWESGGVCLDGSVGRVYARLSGCRIEENLNWGAFSGGREPVDARGCWWGDATGPFHPATNPLGLGNTVSDNVIFDPWLRGNLAPLPLPQTISLADLDGTAYRDTVVVEYLGGGMAPLYGHSTEIHWDAAVASLVEVSRPRAGEFADAVFFEVLPLTDGLLVDSALGGAHPGVDSAPLFRLVFEAVGTPDHTVTPLELVLRHARDQYNQSINGLTVDHGELVVDLQAPVITSVQITNSTLDHTDLYAKDGDMVSVSAFITDGDPNFQEENIRGAGAGLFGYALPYDPPDVYLSPQALWAARPATLTPADGEVQFMVEAWDPSGNPTDMVYVTITADNTPPTAVTGFVVTHDHNVVHLSWDDPTGNDLNFRQLQVRANAWNDYPFYDNGDPGYPGLLTDGDPWYAGGGTGHDAVFATDGSERDIFYLGAMVEDMAGHQSVVDNGNRARTINYILGDVRGTGPATPGDGVVTIHDITQLGDAYDLITSDPGFDGECDIAPATVVPETIPVPDGEVGFDDLMVMAGQFAPVPGAEPAPEQGDQPVLVWRALGDGVWSLDLTEPCPRLKGVHLVGAALGTTVRAEPGALLAHQTSPVFVRGGRGACEAHLAILGRGMGVEGVGELLRLVTDPGVTLAPPVLDLRDVDNQPLVCNLPTAINEPDTPSVFRAGRPHPNPFNPSTTLSFDLPATQAVRLMVYNLSGRRVATLINETLPAGRHAARWQGRDHAGRLVAAGTYLYRLQAGPWSAVGKLELVK